jgi:cytoskeletal protein CcmA (bactofilin family)
MWDTMFKAIKDGIMASNAYGKDLGSREHAFSTDSRTGLQSGGVASERHSQEVLSEDAASGRHLSVVGPSVTFRGSLTAEEDLLIQGCIEGSITHNATNLTIGSRGDVRADIVAHRVIIQGKLEGDVHASEAIVVEASAQVHGNLFSPRVALRDGAKFKGGIDMEVAGHATGKSGRGDRTSSGKATHKSGGEGFGENTVNELLERPHS